MGTLESYNFKAKNKTINLYTQFQTIYSKMFTQFWKLNYMITMKKNYLRYVNINTNK